MTILRIKSRENPYIQLDRRMIQDDTLSWSARGLLTYLLSLPMNWCLCVNDLVNRSPMGRDGVYKIIQELKQAGYILYTRPRLPNGRLGKAEYQVFEEPQVDNSPHPEIPDVVENAVFSPHTAFPDREIPDRVFPDRVKPDAYIINNIQNKQSKNKTEAESRVSLVAEEEPIAPTASADFVLDDLLIGDGLTAKQSQDVQLAVRRLHPQYLTHIPLSEAIEAVAMTILDPKAYSKAGKEFALKLNTVKKSIAQGTWTPPLSYLTEKQRAEKMAEEAKRKAEALAKQQALEAEESRSKIRLLTFVDSLEAQDLEALLKAFAQHSTNPFVIDLAKKASEAHKRNNLMSFLSQSGAMRSIFSDFLALNYPHLYSKSPLTLKGDSHVATY